MQTTRQRILEILKEKRQATVEELSEELELTPVTVRHHLEILRGEGLISAPSVLRRPGPGRPQHTYALTEAAGDLGVLGGGNFFIEFHNGYEADGVGQAVLDMTHSG